MNAFHVELIPLATHPAVAQQSCIGSQFDLASSGERLAYQNLSRI